MEVSSLQSSKFPKLKLPKPFQKFNCGGCNFAFWGGGTVLQEVRDEKQILNKFESLNAVI